MDDIYYDFSTILFSIPILQYIALLDYNITIIMRIDSLQEWFIISSLYNIGFMFWYFTTYLQFLP
jgi:hypothetical protein